MFPDLVCLSLSSDFLLCLTPHFFFFFFSFLLSVVLESNSDPGFRSNNVSDPFSSSEWLSLIWNAVPMSKKSDPFSVQTFD